MSRGSCADNCSANTKTPVFSFVVYRIKLIFPFQSSDTVAPSERIYKVNTPRFSGDYLHIANMKSLER
jgi:hypothetical protein